MVVRVEPSFRTGLGRRQGRLSFRFVFFFLPTFSSTLFREIHWGLFLLWVYGVKLVGAGTERQDSKLKIEELKSLLSRLAKIKLIVLNGVIAHLRKFVFSFNLASVLQV